MIHIDLLCSIVDIPSSDSYLHILHSCTFCFFTSGLMPNCVLVSALCAALNRLWSNYFLLDRLVFACQHLQSKETCVNLYVRGNYLVEQEAVIAFTGQGASWSGRCRNYGHKSKVSLVWSEDGAPVFYWGASELCRGPLEGLKSQSQSLNPVKSVNFSKLIPQG